MDELSYHRELARRGRDGAETGGAQEQRQRPNALAAAADQMARGVGPWRRSELHRFGEAALDPDQIVAEHSLDLLEPALEASIRRSRSCRSAEGRDRTIEWNRHWSLDLSIVSN